MSVIDIAQRFFGTPYLWGGNSIVSGMDCCLDGDTLIEMDHGFKRIRDINEGESVKSISRGSIVTRKVLGIFNNGIKDVFRVKTTNSNIWATENHKFLTVHIDKTLPIGWATRNSARLEFKLLKELTPKDILIMASNQTGPGTCLIDRNKLKCLGALLGDGYISSKRRIHLALFEESEREEIIESFVRGFNYRNSIRKDNVQGLTFYSGEIAREVASYEICNEKSPKRKLPEWIFKLNDGDLECFLEGYFLTDCYNYERIRNGKISETGKQVGSASKILMEGLHALLLSRGFHVSNITRITRSKDIFIKGKKVINARDFYSFSIYDSAIRPYPARIVPRKNPHNFYNIDHQFVFKTINSINKIGPRETFDLCIEEDHNYFANGFVVHNSGFVLEVLRSVGHNHKDTNAQGIYDYFSRMGWRSQLAPGSLLFFGPGRDKINHVAIALTDRLMIEAGGGDHTTISTFEAQRKNAYVRIRPIKNRGDLIAVLKVEEGK